MHYNYVALGNMQLGAAPAATTEPATKADLAVLDQKVRALGLGMAVIVFAALWLFKDG